MSDAFDAMRLEAGLLTFAELLNRPAWQADGLCKEYPDVSWFPGRGDDVRQAKAICGRCAVQVECARFGLKHDDSLAGIWGGLSARDRRAIRRKRPWLSLNAA